MGLPKGKTNNPNGRPPKSRALTTALEAAIARPLIVDGVRVKGGVVIAQLMTDLITTGTVVLPSGKVLEASPKDWIETVKWVYAHIDGAPKQEVEQSGGLTIKVVYADPSSINASEAP